MMRELAQSELEATPSYLTVPLGMPLEKLNEAIGMLNDLATDKRFEAPPGQDFLSHDEIATRLRLGAKAKTFILLLIYSGRLRGLDSRAGAAGAPPPGAARYRIASP